MGEMIQNLNTFDPFADVTSDGNSMNAESVQQEAIHIRIQQRNGRKTLTTVQGISPSYDLKKIVKYCKKEFCCNGTVVEHSEYGQVIQFQGDQRQNIKDFLIRIKLATNDQIKVHGF